MISADTILNKVNVALRRSGNSVPLNDELKDLIEAAQMDLGIAGVVVPAMMGCSSWGVVMSDGSWRIDPLFLLPCFMDNVADLDFDTA